MKDPSNAPKDPLGLDLNNDPRAQRKGWMVQRGFWAFFYGLMIAVMLGIVGKGVLSYAEVESTDGSFRMQYERFLRYQAPDELRLTLFSAGHFTRVTFNSEYFRDVGVKRIIPEPREILMTTEAVTLIFTALPVEETRITVDVSPRTVGLQEAWIAVDNQSPIPFKQFIYP